MTYNENEGTAIYQRRRLTTAADIKTRKDNEAMTETKPSYEEVLNYEMNEIDKAKTWDDIETILLRMQSQYAIIRAEDLAYWIDEVSYTNMELPTLAAWKDFASAILAIPDDEEYFLYTDYMTYEPVHKSDMDRIKELCRNEAKDFAAFLTR